MKHLILTFFLLSAMVQAQKWEWATQGTANANQISTNIVTDRFGNSFVLVITKAQEQFNGHQVNAGYVVIKYDPSGTILLAKNIAFSPSDMKVDWNGNLFLLASYTLNVTTSTGTFSSKGNSDLLLVKYDPQLNELWSRTYGSADYDSSVGITTDQNGNCYLTGNFKGDTLVMNNSSLAGNVSPGTYYANFFIACINPTGTEVWLKNGTQLSATIAWPTSITSGPNSNVCILYMAHSPTLSVYRIATLDPSGTILDDKILASSTPNQVFNPSYFNLKMDDAGDIFVQSDGYRYEHGVIIKYDKDLNHIFTFDLGAAWSCKYYYDHDIDGDGNLYLFGTTTPPGGYCSNTSNTSYDVFVLKVDEKGKVMWTKFATGEGHEISCAMDADHEGNCYVTGMFNDKGNINNSTVVNIPAKFDNHTLVAGNQFSHVFTARIGSTNPLAGVKENEMGHVKVYPNPSGGKFNITGVENAQVTVRNVLGSTVLRSEMSSPEEIDLGGEPKGIYFIEIKSGESCTVCRIVKN